MSAMRCLALMLLLLLPRLTTARAQELPQLWGAGLDWSSDARYIAVTTDKGVHIHNSDDLSVYRVVNDWISTAIKWSNHGLKLAFQSEDGLGVTVWDLRSEEETYLSIYGVQDPVQITSIQWAPESEALAIAFEREVQIHNFEQRTVRLRKSFEALYHIALPQIHWRPGGPEIMSGPFLNGIAIWHRYTGMLIDFIWNREGGNSPLRWSPDGNMIAAGNGPVTVWRVKPGHPHSQWEEIGGERIHEFDYERGRLWGMSWHPDSTKLAFIFSHVESGYPPKRDFSRDGALIWDISTDATRLIPDVFIIDTPYHTDKVIEWSPDGSKLAAVSSDGRVVMWETDTYLVIAEYDSYRSLLDW
ncbi:MAG: WD40 repeat domain-containing protein [Chloroflexi bacterium]|nr:WD40 repeat domain-containing protein [Chloroflexota bacterium]